MARYSLKGSTRKPIAGAHAIGKADPAERLEVSVVVRRRDSTAFATRLSKLATGGNDDGCLTREAFAAQFGAADSDMAAVRDFAVSQGLTVVQEHAGRRTLVLSGTVAQFNGAFNVELDMYEHPGGAYRGRSGDIHLPDALHGIVEAVLGLDNRPQASPHFRLRRAQGHFSALAAATSYTPTTLATLYGFPQGTGQGECIALIELGGGYRPKDLDAYFSGLGLTTPKVTTVSVDHGKNAPTGSANGPDGEVMLDIEVAGAIAPGAKIAVYFAPNTDAGFLDAITTAVHDTTNKPSVISISWGGPESSWTGQSTTAFDDAFQAAAMMGITVCVASGDNGSSDGVTDGADHVDFPASSPHVLACGGTSLQASAAAIGSETVWNDGSNGGAGGGGISTIFALPAWQQGLATRKAGVTAPLPNRGVPDVAGDADPETGYQVQVDGSNTVIGGTSAVAPLWAGLIARINASKGTPAGFINPRLYQNAGVTRDITQGTNGDFSATAGWDACTGLGSPDGQKLATLLIGASSS